MGEEALHLMNWKKVLGWGFGIVIFVVGIISSSYFLLSWGEKPAEQTSTNSENQVESTTMNSENFDEVVHTPADQSIITMANGSDGHSFIAKYHKFYNDSLGWNRIHSADYDEQVKVAKEIIEQIDGAQINNEKLANDLATIKDLAESLISKESRQTMRKLHRYFHDLDIYLNGYDRASTFGYTEYKGEN